MPKVFHKVGHSNLMLIIESPSSEVFIERPRSLDVKASTWSDYKLYNSVKFLIGTSLTGYVTFFFDCCSGRTSDKFITADSEFYHCLSLYDEVMADRGFQIKEELILKFCDLNIPPGGRLKVWMTTVECKTNKDVANLKIHVERAINRIKS